MCAQTKSSASSRPSDGCSAFTASKDCHAMGPSSSLLRTEGEGLTPASGVAGTAAALEVVMDSSMASIVGLAAANANLENAIGIKKGGLSIRKK